MAGFSNTMEQAVLNWIFHLGTMASAGGTAGAGPAILEISLHTADPVDVGAAGEVSTTSTGYSRLEQTNVTGTALWSAPTLTGSSYTVTNTVDLLFPAGSATASASWGTLTHFGIWTGISGATPGTIFLGQGTINGGTGVVVSSGNQLVFTAGNLAFALD